MAFNANDKLIAVHEEIARIGSRPSTTRSSTAGPTRPVAATRSSRPGSGTSHVKEKGSRGKRQSLYDGGMQPRPRSTAEVSSNVESRVR